MNQFGGGDLLILRFCFLESRHLIKTGSMAAVTTISCYCDETPAHPEELRDEDGSPDAFWVMKVDTLRCQQVFLWNHPHCGMSQQIFHVRKRRREYFQSCRALTSKTPASAG